MLTINSVNTCVHSKINLEKISTALLDTAASLHLLRSDAHAVESKEKGNKSLSVADGRVMTTSKNKKLDLTKLPEAAREAHVLKKLQHNLISVRKLCDAGCIVTFDEDKAIVKNWHNETIMQTARDTKNGLWRVSIVENKKCIKFGSAAETKQVEQVRPNTKVVIRRRKFVNSFQRELGAPSEVSCSIRFSKCGFCWG